MVKMYWVCHPPRPQDFTLSSRFFSGLGKSWVNCKTCYILICSLWIVELWFITRILWEQKGEGCHWQKSRLDGYLLRGSAKPHLFFRKKGEKIWKSAGWILSEIMSLWFATGGNIETMIDSWSGLRCNTLFLSYSLFVYLLFVWYMIVCFLACLFDQLFYLFLCLLFACLSFILSALVGSA